MYFVIAIVAFFGITGRTALRKDFKDISGTVLLALIWPVLIPAGAYFLVKKFVFHRHGPSEKLWELEALGILAVTAVGLVFWKFPQLFFG